MPGFLINANSTTVICGHGGKIQLTPSIPPRVKVGGQPAVASSLPNVVQGCPMAASGAPPCITTQSVMPAVRVKIGGQAAMLFDSKMISPQTGTPPTAIVPQPRVKGI